MASKTSFYNNSGVTNEQSNAIDASVSNAEASATSASNSATAAANSASSASTSAATATTSKDAAVVAKDAAVVAKNAAEAAAGGVSGALAISNNLSDLANASTARTNLGVAIGSNVQAYSSVLQSTTAAYTSALNTKLNGIEANATADQTKSDIDALGINATSVSGFTVGKSVPSNAVFTDTNTTYSVGDGGLTQNNFTNADHTKLDGIEASADVTDTANVVAALTAGTNITIAANGTIASTASGGSSYTHPNHSGEVTSSGDGATVIASNVVDADNLKVSGNGSNTQFLRSDGDGTFTWATPVDTNTTYTVGDGALTQKNFTTALKTKLDSIEASATADQTDAEIRAAVEAASDSNVFTDADHTKLNGIATGATAYTNANAVSAVTASDLDMGGNKVLFSNVYSALSDLPSASSNHGMFAHVHATGKGYYAHGGNWIELANASELSDENFTTADHSKLNGIETGATADQTASEIRTLVESATDSNVFTDADHGKLNGIATSANNYTHPNHTGEVTSTSDGSTVIVDNVVDEANLKVSNTPTNGYVLTAQSGVNGGLTWAAAASGGGGADLYTANESSPSAQPSATGTNAIAIGDSAVSAGSRTIAFSKSRAAGWDSIAGAILNNTASYGTTSEGNIVFGEKAKVTGSASQGIGKLSVTSGSQSMGLGYTATASGLRSYAFGYGASASNTDSVSIGRSVTSTASNQVNIGGDTQDVRISETYTLPKVDGTASGQVLTTNGSGVVSWATPSGGGGGADLYTANESSPSAQPSATGTNAIAIGDSAISSNTNSFALNKSQASGTNSFAAQITDSTTSYGAIGVNSISIGRWNKSSGSGSISVGGAFAWAQGGQSIAIGKNAYANQSNSVVLGVNGVSDVQGKFVFSSNQIASNGDSQLGLCILRVSTTDATATTMRTLGATSNVIATNQMTLPNNSAYTFSGTVVAREKASEGTDVGAWEVKGIIRREANAGTTVLVNSVINELNAPTGWAVALTADTTLGCLKVAVTGVASTNIRWVATINTSEVTYA